jgi:hypothetical protein
LIIADINPLSTIYRQYVVVVVVIVVVVVVIDKEEYH